MMRLANAPAAVVAVGERPSWRQRPAGPTARAHRRRRPVPGRERFPICHFHGILSPMKATLDSAGRIVVPKPLRQALGLKPGQALEIRAGDGRLEIEIAPTPMALRKRGKGPVAVPSGELPPLTAEEVRETLERVRR